ncbi:hypothetical protein [Actinomadura rupiterrae]|uniref:hypothetical protein n=1 Tax=Actinomadura rupiterrae TaxID=559627 RepID=UPI0020A3623C|nr:hypothetical protein [Actinomadura rupiterrae]MCP2341565.1 hypothetical protein [Actinomadura rupiterrae]
MHELVEPTLTMWKLTTGSVLWQLVNGPEPKHGSDGEDALAFMPYVPPIATPPPPCPAR